MLVEVTLLWPLLAAPVTDKNASEEPPPIEMLDHLGGWETEDGQRIDPTELEKMEIPDRGKTREKREQ